METAPALFIVLVVVLGGVQFSGSGVVGDGLYSSPTGVVTADNVSTTEVDPLPITIQDEDEDEGDDEDEDEGDDEDEDEGDDEDEDEDEGNGEGEGEGNGEDEDEEDTPTPTQTVTATSTPTPSPASTPTQTPTPSPTSTPSPTATSTPDDDETGHVEIIDVGGLPDWVKTGYDTTVRVTVVNPGNRTANRTLTATVDGEAVANETVTLDPGERTDVTIEFEAVEGTVAVEEVEAGELNVSETLGPGDTPTDDAAETAGSAPGFGLLPSLVAVIILAGGAFSLVRRRQ